MRPHLVRVFYTRHRNISSDGRFVDLVQWCKAQIENYTVLFGKQVFSPDADPKMIAECNDITRMQNKKVRVANPSLI